MNARGSKKIYYYNADEGRLPILGALEAAVDQTSTTERLELSRLEEGMPLRWFWESRNSIFVFHRSPLAGGENDEIDLFDNLQDSQQSILPGSVIVRVSTCPLEGIQKRVDFEDGPEWRYLLYVPDTREAGLVGEGSALQWSRLLKALSETRTIDRFLSRTSGPCDLYKDEISILRQTMQPLFACAVARLRLLCLGFLLCHHDSWPIKDGITRGLNTLTLHQFAVLESRRDLTEQSHWWTCVLGEHMRSGRLFEEFKTLDGATPEALKTLLRRLAECKTPSIKNVSDAYQALRQANFRQSLLSVSKKANIVHQWLANRYFNRISAMRIRLETNYCTQKRIKDFVDNDLSAWPTQFPRLMKALSDLEAETSPRLLIDRGPAILRSDDYSWMASILHDIWLNERQIPELSVHCLSILRETDKLHRTILGSVASHKRDTVTIDLRILSSIQSSCQELVKSFSALPNRVELP